VTTSHTFKAEMGVLYRDRITNFEGIATSLAVCITGCDRVLLEPMVQPDGKTPDAIYIDDHRLEYKEGRVWVPLIPKLEERKAGAPPTRGVPIGRG
jgi:hypothetical protein